MPIEGIWIGDAPFEPDPYGEAAFVDVDPDPPAVQQPRPAEERDLRYQIRLVEQQEGTENRTYWGGTTACIEITDGPNGGWYDWLYMGDELVKRFHRACGEYLARKAKAERDANAG